MTPPTTSDGQPGYIITLKDVHEAVLKLGASLAGLPAKVDENTRQLADHEVRIRRVEDDKLSVDDYRIEKPQWMIPLKDHEGRIRVIERLGNRFGGAWGIVAGVLAIGGGVIIDHIIR